MSTAPLFCNINSVVSRCAVGFIGALSLFIDYDKPDVVKGRKYRTSRTYRYFSKSSFKALVFVHSLSERQTAVYHRHRFTEKRTEPVHRLRSQRYLGYKKYRLSAHFKASADELFKDRGLAASRNAVEQKAACLSAFHYLCRPVIYLLLFICKHYVVNAFCSFLKGIHTAENFVVLFCDNALFYKLFFNGYTNAAKIAGFLYGDILVLVYCIKQRLLLGGELEALRVGFVAVCDIRDPDGAVTHILPARKLILDIAFRYQGFKDKSQSLRFELFRRIVRVLSTHKSVKTPALFTVGNTVTRFVRKTVVLPYVYVHTRR